ncbi:MAG: flagellin [Opitutae bacterium]|nr:flagellin [Opitutae bacterium]
MIGVDTSSIAKTSVSMHRSANRVQDSVGRLLNSGNAVESLRGQGDSGGLSMVSRLGAENRTKTQLAQSMQNAVTYIHMQEAGLKKAHQIYERMSVLASQAMDPMLSDSDRANLNSEFQALKKETFSMRSEKFQGSYLFDDMAAKYFPEIDFGKGFNDQVSGDSEVEVGILTSAPSGWTGTKKYYQLEKEVHFNSGKFVLDINGGGTGERYILKQGSEVIFDTAGNDVDNGLSKDMQWATEGTAYDHDFDRFEMQYAPGQETKFKFVPLTAGNSTRVVGADGKFGTSDDPSDTWSNDTRYDNKDTYISQLGLGTSAEGSTEESTPWLSGDDRTNHYFSGSLPGGEWKTNPANGLSTKLTLRVEANTIFQINATYTPLDEPTNDKKLVGIDGNDINLNSVGIGIILVDSSIDSIEQAKETLNFLEKEIENVSTQMATLGANMSQLEIAGERLSNQVYLSEAGISRLTSDVLVDESTRLAKEQIRLQSTQALLAQAFSLTENILNTLL